MDIRLAERGDIPQMIPLLNTLDQLHLKLYPDRFRALPRGTRTPQMITDLMKSKAWQIWLATEPGKVWGLMALEYRTRTGTIVVPEQYVLVDMIVVAEEKRGMGIGKQLMAFAEEEGRRQGCKRIELKVYDRNEAALGWYESIGFGQVIHTLARKIEASPPKE